MTLFGRHLNLGIAYTDQGAATLQLARSGNFWRVLALHYVSWKNEGLTDSVEIQQTAMEWLHDAGASAGREVCCLLPQSTVNTVISDFPPVHEKDKLTKMVSYQTQQLEGLAGTELVNGFQEVVPMPGQTNPMLIAVAPQTELDKWGDFYREASVDVSQFVPAGLALYNAFALLQDLEATESGLQAILECGETQSILVISWQSRIQAVQLLDLPAHDAKAYGKGVLATLHAWTNTQMGEGRFAVPTKLWISGELATTDGFLEGVAQSAELPVQLLGLPARACPQGATAGPVKNGVYPAMTLAFGLAAQNLGLAPLNISLLPEKLAWQQERLREVPYLILATLLIVALLSWMFYNLTRDIVDQELQFQRTERLLDSCLETAPKLKRAYQELQDKQLEMLPIVEASLRTKRFVSAIQTWYDAVPIPKQDAWCIYLADEFSFDEDNSTRSLTQSPSVRRDSRSSNLIDPAAELRPALGGPATIGGSHSEEMPESVPVMPPATPVLDLPLLTKMYAGGILPATTVKYQAMKDFQGELNRSDDFINVDDYSDFLSKDFVTKNLAPWENFLKTYRNTLPKDYTLFFLQLPFLEEPVKLPASSQSSPMH